METGCGEVEKVRAPEGDVAKAAAEGAGEKPCFRWKGTREGAGECEPSAESLGSSRDDGGQPAGAGGRHPALGSSPALNTCGEIGEIGVELRSRVVARAVRGSLRAS